jgi:phage FluMu gp28-like protein
MNEKGEGRREKAETAASPLSTLLPYQRAWIDDASRFKIGLMARQTGKSWTSALEAVRDCLEHKTTWVCLSSGERQALEWMRKAREHAEAFSVALDGYTEDRDSAEALLKAAEIQWPNGSRILAIPANPSTARGYSANLLLDEFAFHESPDQIWRAIYPSISNPLKGTFKIRIVSTPNGLGNKFADLWHKGAQWAKHRVDIYDAVRLGLPLEIEELKAGLDDPEAWAQEYECQFLDAAAVLLPYELIARCESADCVTNASPEYWRSLRPRYLGLDFGRKKDLSVCWTLEQIGDVAHTADVLEMRGVSTPEQIERLRPRILAARRISVDYTGPGIGLGDYLVKEFGEYKPDAHLFGKVELNTFSNPMKVDIFSKLRMAFEGGKVRVPVDRAIREDLHSMQRVTTQAGTVTYKAPHTEDGHADRCTALALAVRAFGTGAAGAITDPSGIRIGQNQRPGLLGRIFTPRRLVRNG